MIPIKFRGKSIKTGKYVCGGYFQDHAHYIVAYDALLDCSIGIEVDPTTIKQLCGYDADGLEVYEDDEVRAASIDPEQSKKTLFRGKVYRAARVDTDKLPLNPRLEAGCSAYEFRLTDNCKRLYKTIY